VRSSRTVLPILWTLAVAATPASSQPESVREFEFLYPADTVCIPATYYIKLQAFDKKKRDTSVAMKSPTPYLVAVVEATVYPLTSGAISDAYVMIYINGLGQKTTSYADRRRYEDTQGEIRHETIRLANEICQIRRYPGTNAFTAKDPRFNQLFWLFSRAFDILDLK
jgi:hypothetical protein